MAVIAFDINQTRDYILRQEKDADEPTVFKLGVLDSALSAHLFDSQATYTMSAGGPEAKADIKLNRKALNRDIVKFGLKGWANLKDAQGNELKTDFISYSISGIGNRNGLTPRCLDYLRPWLDELAEAIERDHTFSPEEERNFDSPSS